MVADLPQALAFDPRPTFPHLAPERAAVATKQFHQFQAQLAATPEDVLHRAVHGASKLRAHALFLLTKYLARARAPLDDLKHFLGETAMATDGLLRPSADGSRTTVNLAALDADALHAAYLRIPASRRQRTVHPSERDTDSPTFTAALVTRPKAAGPGAPSGVRKSKKHGFKRGRPPSAPSTSSTPRHFASWVQCNSCLKWRRIYGDPAALPDVWSCAMHATAGMSCAVPEEAMDADETPL